MFIGKKWILVWVVLCFIIWMGAFNAGILRGSEPPVVQTIGENTALMMLNPDGTYFLVSSDLMESKMGCISGARCDE